MCSVRSRNVRSVSRLRVRHVMRSSSSRSSSASSSASARGQVAASRSAASASSRSRIWRTSRVGAATAGLLWATVNAHTADVVPDRHLPRAVAVVLGGGTLGTVVGIPLASLAARLVDWRLASAGVAVGGLLVAVAVRTVVAPAPRPAPDGAAAGAGAPATRAHARVRAVVTIGALLAVLLVGHFAAYTFVTRLVDAPAAALPGGVSTMLLVLGGTSALGLVLAGRADATLERWLVVSATGTALALAALGAVERHVVVAVAVVAAWGLASGATPPLVQTLMLRRGGPEARDTTGMLLPVAFNLGIAVGAASGSLLVERAGVGAIPLPAAVVALAGAAGLAVVTGAVRVRRRASRQVRAADPACAPCTP